MIFKRMLSPWTDIVYAFLRVAAGLMFGFHGLQIVFHVLMPAGMQPHPWQQAWCGGVIELITGILIALGLFTDCAAFVASGTMAVAYLQFHWRFKFGADFFPAVNHGELALLYCALFLYVVCRGSGRYSLDSLRKRGS